MARISRLAETLIPSEIIKLGNEINDKIRQGQSIYNYTIGDFDPNQFPIPPKLQESIIQAYELKKTNYPPANGIPELRQAVSSFIEKFQGLNYSPNQFLISGGGRPLIYAAYRTICDAGEKVIYPVPSWNNNHYTHFVSGDHCMVETTSDTDFLPSAESLIPHFERACLLALCSPLNPTGTLFSREQLDEICQAVLAENKRRSADEKPLYILYDQIYWTLTYGGHKHVDPVSLYPELREYTIYIDGISKSFCATGVRVGWAFGPEFIIDKMKGILSHIGAWSPMAEQYGTALFLNQHAEVNQALSHIRNGIESRLNILFQGFNRLKLKGLPIDVIEPKAAMYLTIRFAIKNHQTSDGHRITTTQEISSYLLNEASLAVVPFAAFGADRESDWYRLSVGTCEIDTIPEMLQQLESALSKLSPIINA